MIYLISNPYYFFHPVKLNAQRYVARTEVATSKKKCQTYSANYIIFVPFKEVHQGIVGDSNNIFFYDMNQKILTKKVSSNFRFTNYA